MFDDNNDDFDRSDNTDGAVVASDVVDRRESDGLPIKVLNFDSAGKILD
jgi:hypothetical protein